eukprot:1160132-Pelagomonas_calceolata.AAC.2
MGCFGSSKSNKVAPQSAPVERKPSSAPAGLEVDKEWQQAAPRHLSDNGESFAGGGEEKENKETGRKSPQAVSSPVCTSTVQMH